MKLPVGFSLAKTQDGYDVFNENELVGSLTRGAYSRTGGTGWGISIVNSAAGFTTEKSITDAVRRISRARKTA